MNWLWWRKKPEPEIPLPTQVVMQPAKEVITFHGDGEVRSKVFTYPAPISAQPNPDGLAFLHQLRELQIEKAAPILPSIKDPSAADLDAVSEEIRIREVTGPKPKAVKKTRLQSRSRKKPATLKSKGKSRR